MNRMNRTVQTTWWLAGLLVVGLAGDIALRTTSGPAVDDLPALADYDILDASKVRLTREEETLIFVPYGDTGWKMTSPLDAVADRQAVRQILMAFRKGVSMDVQVDEGNLDLYGLEQRAIRVEIWDSGEEPAVDVYVGLDTVGGASFVRLPGSDTVYRARVGGRHRLDKPPRDWRDPTVVGLEPDDTVRIALNSATGPVELVRDKVPPPDDAGDDAEPTFTPWRFPDDADFPVDQLQVQSLLSSLATLRAGALLGADHPSGLDRPAVVLAVESADGETTRVAFALQDDAAYARRAGEDTVFQIAPSVVKRLARPRPAWHDRQLFDVDRASIRRMVWRRPDGDVRIVEQDPATSQWTVVEPPGVDVTLRDAMQTAIELAELRADEVAAGALDLEQIGFPSNHQIELQLVDGSRRMLEIGSLVPGTGEGREAVFVRTADVPDRIAVLSARQLLPLRAGFGG